MATKGKSKVTAEKCEIAHCDRPRLSANTSLCKACYSSLKYHLILGPQHVMAWAKRVRIFGGRVAEIQAGATPKLIESRRKKFNGRKRRAA